MDMLSYATPNQDFGSTFMNAFGYEDGFADYAAFAAQNPSNFLYSERVLSDIPDLSFGIQEKECKPSRKEKSLELLSQM